MKKIKLKQKDLNFINWKISDIEKIPKEYKEIKRIEYQKIKRIDPKNRTFKNTILAIEYSDEKIKDKISALETLFYLSPKENIRKASLKASTEISKIAVDLEYDKDIYKAIIEYKRKKEKLNAVDKKLFEDYLKTYRRMGFGLSQEKQKNLKKISKRLSNLSSKFGENINKYQDNITVSKEETEGLSKNYLSTLNKDKKGKYIVSLDYPESGPFMSSSSNDKLRKKLAEKLTQKGGKKNLKILNEILDLRKKRANLLGYKNHAEYVLERRMAKNQKTVDTFLSNLLEKTKKGAEEELKKLQYLKNKESGGRLKFYDIAYYSEKLEKELFKINQEKIREYFPLDAVLDFMFENFGKLFYVQFKKTNFRLWHKDAVIYEIKSEKETIGYLIFDLFPRKGKYGHACMLPLVEAREFKNEYKLPVANVICNFRRGTRKIPPLLSMREVETLFHEFGHSIHSTLTKAIYLSQSGTNVSWDFVETPSQLLENWFWNEKSLKKLSKHYKTRETLPQKDIKNILRSKDFMIKTFTVRQLILGIFDMELHTKGHKNPEKLYLNLVKKHTKQDVYQNSLFPAGFGHLIGYDAGYYSYMWALVYADDIFSKFQEKGIFNKQIGAKYRKEVLETGSSREESESVRKFLGRNPNNKAFLKNLGIK